MSCCVYVTVFVVSILVPFAVLRLCLVQRLIFSDIFFRCVADKMSKSKWEPSRHYCHNYSHIRAVMKHEIDTLDDSSEPNKQNTHRIFTVTLIYICTFNSVSILIKVDELWQCDAPPHLGLCKKKNYTKSKKHHIP